MENKWTRIRAIIVLILGLMCIALGMKAQNVVQNGKTFIEQVDSSSKKGEPVMTAYTFYSKTGEKYPVYLSSNGNAFIIKTSKKTGKQYRQYLPEITKRLKK